MTKYSFSAVLLLLLLGLPTLTHVCAQTNHNDFQQEADILHETIDLRFDYAKAEIIGKVKIAVQPYFYPIRTLTLNAKGMEFSDIRSVTENKKLSILSYQHELLTLDLGREYQKGENFEVEISYIARPNARRIVPDSSDVGCFFINPNGKTPNLPTQIWTQGETQFNSCWFPTIDQPSERFSQTLTLTVPSQYLTLSNGIKTASVNHLDGSRTDTWEQKFSLPAYLSAFVIGDFAEIKDRPAKVDGREVPITYYVEKQYQAQAMMIFGKTPEMIEFFSKKLGVAFPWDKYAQIVVRGFESGAMENTGCVLHNERTQHDERDHLDRTFEDVIAHELFHHWFGDLVTCKNWANLTLNEGFADYGEYLWWEYKYGLEVAEWLRLTDDNDEYLNEVSEHKERLINYLENNPDALFDNTRYDKGSCVIHLLRKQVGDAAFFAAITHYLKTNAHTSVEIDKLRIAFETVSGQNLKWFFDQWFLHYGHPILLVSYKTVGNKTQVNVSQCQDTSYQKNGFVFRLPIKINTFDNNNHMLNYQFEMWTRDTIFFLPNSTYQNICFDPSNILLAEVREEKAVSCWEYQALNGENFGQKYRAFQKLQALSSETSDKVVLNAATKDPFWAVRQKAIISLTGKENNYPQVSLSLLQKYLTEPSVKVRVAILNYMLNEKVISTIKTNHWEKEMNLMLEKAIKDSSYEAQGKALLVLEKWDTPQVLQKVQSLSNSTSTRVKSAICTILINNQPIIGFNQILSQMQTMNYNRRDSITIAKFADYLAQNRQKLSEKEVEAGLYFLMNQAEHAIYWKVKQAAIGGLANFSSNMLVKDFAKKQLVVEPNIVLKKGIMAILVR